jgi:hypothetical protein
MPVISGVFYNLQPDFEPAGKLIKAQNKPLIFFLPLVYIFGERPEQAVYNSNIIKRHKPWDTGKPGNKKRYKTGGKHSPCKLVNTVSAVQKAPQSGRDTLAKILHACHIPFY